MLQRTHTHKHRHTDRHIHTEMLKYTIHYTIQYNTHRQTYTDRQTHWVDIPESQLGECYSIHVHIDTHTNRHRQTDTLSQCLPGSAGRMLQCTHTLYTQTDRETDTLSRCRPESAGRTLQCTHTHRLTDTQRQTHWVGPPESAGSMLKTRLQLLSLTAIKQLQPLLQHYLALDSLVIPALRAALITMKWYLSDITWQDKNVIEDVLKKNWIAK